MLQASEQLKSEISEYYLKDFKEELGWMKSLALFPIQKKVKKILMGEFQLPEKFNEVEEFGWWKEIINFVSPQLANRIFDFMKEKRLELEKRKTENELLALKAEILGKGSSDSSSQISSESVRGEYNSQSSASEGSGSENIPVDNEESEVSQPVSSGSFTDTNAVGAGIGTSVGGMTVTRCLQRGAEIHDLKRMQENLTPEKIRNVINKSIEVLEKQKMSSRLTDKQITTIEKHISKLKENITGIDDESVALLKEWQKLDAKFPKKLLKTAGLTPKQLAKIEKLAPHLVGKDPKIMKTFLVEKGLSDVNDEVISALAKAGSVQELKTMTRILKHGTKTTRALKAFSGAMFIDVAFLGFDVWTYLESQKEAELVAKVNELRAKNKSNQATTQLLIGVGSVAVEASIILIAMAGGTAVGGPFGLVVGLAVGVASAAISAGVDTLYFDVKDFYMQNREDFLRQKKSQLNQAILQGIHNRKEGNDSLNEYIGSPEPAQKAQSLSDACWSMLFLDELYNGDFASYSPFWDYVQSGQKRSDFVDALSSYEAGVFRKKWDEIEQKISKRMEYIRHAFEQPTVLQALKCGNAMQYISTLFTQSKAFVEMQVQAQRDQTLDFDTNLRHYKSVFFADFPKAKLLKIEKLKKQHPYLFQEIMVTANLSSLVKETEIDQHYDENVKLVAAYQKWIALTATDGEKIQLDIPDTHKNMRFIEKLLEQDFDLDKVSFPTNSEQQLKTLVSLREERRGYMEISDNPIQNTFYRLAKELYGYTGKNDLSDIMAFYSEDSGGVHGMYYKDARKMNDDWHVDDQVHIGAGFETFPSEAEVENYVHDFVSRNFERQIGRGISHKKFTIDTPTEAIDGYLQKEFESQITTILKEELLARTQKNQQKIKNQISMFVQKHAKNGNYVELPYYLLLSAKKAGFGDLQRQFFTRKNGEMEICYMKSELSSSQMLDAKRTYLTQAREHFTEEEQIWIDRVEKAHQQLENLRNIEGTASFEDDLDLPKEIEWIISDKYKEWLTFKQDLLMYSPESASGSEVLAKYQEFALYFERLYRGILLSLSGFKMTNDIDSFNLYCSALGLGNQDLFDQEGKLSSDINIDFLKYQVIVNFYNDQLKNQKIDGKSLATLWVSKDAKERELARQASEVIITLILEQNFLIEDKMGKIIRIAGNGKWLHYDPSLPKNEQKFMEKKIQEILSQLSLPSVIDSEKIQKLLQPQSIQELTPLETGITTQIPLLQKQIESTMSEVVWQGKRGNISYHPDTSTLSSREHAVKVEMKAEKFYLEGLDVELTLEEVVWLANFRNWVKYKYSKETVAFETERMRDALVLKGEGVLSDDTMLISQDNFVKYCPVGKDDTVMHKITDWLNSEFY